MKLAIPYKSLALNFFITIIITLEFIYLIQPNIQKINTIKSSIQEQLLSVDKQLSQGQTIKTTQERLKSIQPFLEKLSASFLKKEGQLLFITTLEDKADQNNIVIEIELADIPDVAGETNEVFTIPLSLSLRGTYDDTILFMISMQKLDYHINIIDLSLNPENQVTGSQIISTQLRANTYWQ